MSFCLNPACAKPDNPDNNQYCHGCIKKSAANPRIPRE